MCDARAAIARQLRGRRGGGGRAAGPLHPPDMQKPACAHKHTQQRERGAGGRNGGGGVPSNWGKRADAMGKLEAR